MFLQPHCTQYDLAVVQGYITEIVQSMRPRGIFMPDTAHFIVIQWSVTCFIES